MSTTLNYHWLRYFVAYFGGSIVEVRGDRFKRKWLMPVYLLIHALGRPWSRAVFFSRRARPWEHRNRVIYAQVNSPAMLLSRTMVVVIQKAPAESPAPTSISDSPAPNLTARTP